MYWKISAKLAQLCFYLFSSYDKISLAQSLSHKQDYYFYCSRKQMICAMYTLTIKGKTVSIFPSLEADDPIIYLNTFSGEGQKVYEAAQAARCLPFTLVAISNLD